MSLFLKGLETLLGSNPYTSGVGDFIFGSDEASPTESGSSNVDTSSSESAFADLLNSDSDFADLYNALQDDPDSVYSTINPIGYDADDPFAYLYESDPEFMYDILTGGGINTVDPEGTYSPEEYKGIFGLGIGPYLKDTFLGTDDEQGLLEQIIFGKASQKEGGGNTSGGITGILGGLLGGGDEGGGLLSSPLVKLLLANYLSKKDEGPSDIVPVGQQAFAAGGQGIGSMPDYRVFNLQPALMPGVGYANAPPPGMKHGGVHGAGKREGPGDITLARLEPGEFVMTRKATDNIGARNLYSLMKQAERMG